MNVPACPMRVVGCISSLPDRHWRHRLFSPEFRAMFRSNLIATLTIVLLFNAARADDLKPQTIDGWGTVVDPDGDCRFAESNGKLTITVPGTYHDLTHSEGRDQLNSPRVIQEVKGDF